jgi:hypothetical protein
VVGSRERLETETRDVRGDMTFGLSCGFGKG